MSYKQAISLLSTMINIMSIRRNVQNIIIILWSLGVIGFIKLATLKEAETIAMHLTSTNLNPFFVKMQLQFLSLLTYSKMHVYI